MADMKELLEEAIELGILNIDFDSEELTPDILIAAIEETKRLHSELDDDVIAKEILEAGLIATNEH